MRRIDFHIECDTDFAILAELIFQAIDQKEIFLSLDPSGPAEDDGPARLVWIRPAEVEFGIWRRKLGSKKVKTIGKFDPAFSVAGIERNLRELEVPR